jgi:hypothetical protein
VLTSLCCSNKERPSKEGAVTSTLKKDPQPELISVTSTDLGLMASLALSLVVRSPAETQRAMERRNMIRGCLKK